MFEIYTLTWFKDNKVDTTKPIRCFGTTSKAMSGAESSVGEKLTWMPSGGDWMSPMIGIGNRVHIVRTVVE